MTSGNSPTPKAARPPSLLLLASFVALLSGCGGDNPVIPSPPPPPPPPVPVTEVLVEGGGALGQLMLGSLSFDTTKSGKLDVIVDWTYATNDVDVYLAKGICSFDQFVAAQCNVVAFSESTIAKPEKISASDMAPGAYTLLVGNIGPTEDSVSFQVLLTSLPGASSSSAKAAGAAGQPRMAKGQARGMVRLR